MYERLFTHSSRHKSLSADAFENDTSQVYKQMVGSVEIDSHRENPAAVSDALKLVQNSQIHTHIYCV